MALFTITKKKSWKRKWWVIKWIWSSSFSEISNIFGITDDESQINSNFFFSFKLTNAVHIYRLYTDKNTRGGDMFEQNSPNWKLTKSFSVCVWTETLMTIGSSSSFNGGGGNAFNSNRCWFDWVDFSTEMSSSLSKSEFISIIAEYVDRIECIFANYKWINFAKLKKKLN